MKIVDRSVTVTVSLVDGLSSANMSSVFDSENVIVSAVGNMNTVMPLVVSVTDSDTVKESLTEGTRFAMITLGVSVTVIVALASLGAIAIVLAARTAIVLVSVKVMVSDVETGNVGINSVMVSVNVIVSLTLILFVVRNSVT